MSGWFKRVRWGLLGLGVFLGGCQSGDGPAAERPVTLVFKHAKHPRYLELRRLIARFESENPGIRVRQEILPASSDEQHQFYVINLAGGADDFDVLDMDIIWVPEFARAGWLVDLTPHLTQQELQPLNPAALRADSLDARLYAVPWFLDAGVLYYRRDLLEKYGYAPPRTFPELLEQARMILRREQDSRLTGFLWQGRQYEGLICVALEFIRGNGGRLLNSDHYPAADDPAVLQALEFMRSLVYQHRVTPRLVTTLDEEAARHMFQSGRAVFMRNWPYAWSLLQESGSPVAGRIGLTEVPRFPGHESAPTLGGFHLGINSHSRHKEEAVKFIRFMIRRQVQKEILLTLGVLAAHMGVYEDPEVRRRVQLTESLLPALQKVQPRPVTPYYLMISQVLQAEFSAVVAGIRSPEQALRRARSQIQHLLEVR